MTMDYTARYGMTRTLFSGLSLLLLEARRFPSGIEAGEMALEEIVKTKCTTEAPQTRARLLEVELEGKKTGLVE